MSAFDFSQALKVLLQGCIKSLSISGSSLVVEYGDGSTDTLSLPVYDNADTISY